MANSTHETFAPQKKDKQFADYLDSRLFAIIALLAFALIFWWARIENTEAENKIPAGSNMDMYVYHLPVREFGFNRLKSGEAPLWNPYTACGMPFFATYQAALLYPLNFPHWFLPGYLAMSLIYLLHVFLSGFFMYLWARELRLNSAAATFAGIAYMLCTFVNYPFVWPHIILCHTWIPLIFLLLHKILVEARWSGAVLLGLVTGCQFLAGYMQGFVYTLYGAFGYLIFLSVVKLVQGDEKPLKFARSFSFAVAGLIFIPALLTAFQWMPTLQLSQLSARPPGGLSHEAVLIGGSLHPSTFFSALANPDSFKWFQYTLYPGIITLALAVFAFIHGKRWRELVFFSMLGILSALVAFGTHTPIFNLYSYLPTGDWFRLPNRLLILTAFSIATLAAIGCDHLTRDILGKPKPLSAAPARYAIFVAICAGLILLLPKAAGLYIFVALLGCLLAVRGGSGQIVGFLVALLVGMDLILYLFNPVTFPWITRDVFSELKEEKAFLEKNVGLDRVHIFHRSNDWKNFKLNSNFGMVEGIRETSGYESLALQRTAEFFAYMESGGSPSYELPFTGWLRWNSESIHPRMLNLLGARYIVDDPGSDLYPEKAPPNKMPKGFKLKQVFSNDLKIYENAEALPRAFYTNQVEVIKNKRGVLERLAEESFDYKGTIILEEDPPLFTIIVDDTAGNLLPEVTIKPEGEEKIGITVDLPEHGFVFLDDIFMPGWNAKVDGTDTKIYRADYLFMAIPVNKGKHAIELQYMPKSYRFGKWTSCLALTALLLSLAFDVAWNRTRKLEPWEKAGIKIGPAAPKKKPVAKKVRRPTRD